MFNSRQAYQDFISLYFELKDTTDDNMVKFNDMKVKYDIEIPKLDDLFTDLDIFLKSINVNMFESTPEEQKKQLVEKLQKHNKEQKLVEQKIIKIEEELKAQTNENRLADNLDNDLNTSNDKLKLLEERYGLSAQDEEEDYSETHSIAEEDVLNKIETLYDELNDIAKGITKPSNMNTSNIDSGVFDFDENEEEVNEAKMMEKLKLSVEDNKNKSFYLEGQVIKLREEYSRKLDELKKLRELSLKNGAMNNQIEDNIDEEKLSTNLNMKAMSRRNSQNNIYNKGGDNLSCLEKNSSQGADIYSNILYGKNPKESQKNLGGLSNSRSNSTQNILMNQRRNSNYDNQTSDLEIPNILASSNSSYNLGMKSQSIKSIGMGLKWHKDCQNIVNKNQNGESINLDDLVNDEFNEESSDCKKLKKRIMSVISFMQEDY